MEQSVMDALAPAIINSYPTKELAYVPHHYHQLERLLLVGFPEKDIQALEFMANIGAFTQNPSLNSIRILARNVQARLKRKLTTLLDYIYNLVKPIILEEVIQNAPKKASGEIDWKGYFTILANTPVDVSILCDGLNFTIIY